MDVLAVVALFAINTAAETKHISAGGNLEFYMYIHGFMRACH